MKTDIRDAVLATLAFHDALGIPLTPLQAWFYFVNPERIAPNCQIPVITFFNVMQELERLSAEGHIVESSGYFTLSPDNLKICNLHLEREKVVAQKFRRLLNAAFWLQAVPYVRSLAASGSMALGTSEEDGDFDMFVIARAGRLYICRLFLLGMASLLRRRRRPHDRRVSDKFCFNHYVTDTCMTIPYESIYTAHVFARLIPIWDPKNIFQAFWNSNKWINQYICHFHPEQKYIHRNMRPNQFLCFIARILETAMDTKFGDYLERTVKWYQWRRIARNPLTRAPGGRVIFTDEQLEFHPNSIEKAILNRYHGWLVKLNISAPPEADSGLSNG